MTDGSGQCPTCRQRAPILLRGLEARCTICGALRTPFSATAINLAGKPAQIGAVAAKFAGCAVAVVGGSAAIGLGLLLHAFFGIYGGLAAAIPIALITLATTLSLVLGGRWLGQSGRKKERDTKIQALTALLDHQQGDVTAARAARSLDVPIAEADALLTDLARDPESNISLDLDEEGVVHYIHGDGGAALRWRILEERARLAPDAAVADAEREALAHEEADQQSNRVIRP